MTVEINDIEYKVKAALTEEDKIKGLQNIKSLPKNEGMLFIYDEPQTVAFWMNKTLIPLDIIFINEDEEVISIYTGEPNSKDIIEEDNVKYVLEINAGSGIKSGDEVDIDDEDSDEENLDSTSMYVIDSKGGIQMTLFGGERIFSRKNTKTLIKMAKRADKYKTDRYYKSLGKKIFKYIDIQNNNEPEYVSSHD